VKCVNLNRDRTVVGDNQLENITFPLFTHHARKVLVEVLTGQNSGQLSELQKENLQLLQLENTYTVTTGHQINFLLGPWYVMHKVLSTVKLARDLKLNYPEKNFVPLFWLATEDHDWNEIAVLHNKVNSASWPRNSVTPVGMIPTTEVLGLFDEWNVQFPNSLIPTKWIELYKQSETLAEATQRLANYVFSEIGILVLDPNNRQLKEQFLPIALEELSEDKVMNNYPQNDGPLHMASINLFWMEDNRRSRVSLAERKKEEWTELFKKFPERVSPNVATRPLYQELILPNVAYVGGPSEVQYWMSLKKVFTSFNIAFPKVISRDGGWVVSEKKWNKFLALQFSEEDFFTPLHEQLNKRVGADNKKSWDQFKVQLRELLDSMKESILEVDSTLEASWNAENVKMYKSLEHMEHKVFKAQKRKEEELVSFLEKFHQENFVNSIPQERHFNWIFHFENQLPLDQDSWKLYDPLNSQFKLWLY
jgi:bacillithiol biosynthesis cysteine-adding enzyme BshC